MKYIVKILSGNRYMAHNSLPLALFIFFYFGQFGFINMKYEM